MKFKHAAWVSVTERPNTNHGDKKNYDHPRSHEPYRGFYLDFKSNTVPERALIRKISSTNFH